MTYPNLICSINNWHDGAVNCLECLFKCDSIKKATGSMCCSSSLTCSQIQAEVEERAVSQGTQQVVAALERRHQDGARDNFCTHTHTQTRQMCEKLWNRSRIPLSKQLYDSSPEGQLRKVLTARSQHLPHGCATSQMDLGCVEPAIECFCPLGFPPPFMAKLHRL